MTILANCSESPSGPRSSVALRVGGLFAILGGSAFLTLLPLLTRGKFQTFNYLGSVFAAGIILATAFVHILPDADAAMANPCLGFSTNYPWAHALAGASLILLLFVENTVKQQMLRRLGLLMNETEDIPGSQQMIEVKANKEASFKQTEQLMAAIFLEGGIVFHSIFVGINYGVTDDSTQGVPVMVALIFHQAFDGLALGTAFVRAKFSTAKYLAFATIFVLITPIGIAVGIGISKSYATGSKASLASQGTFNAISAGLLIYNGVVNLLVPLFDLKLLRQKWRFQVTTYCTLCAGYVCMAFLAKYA